MPWFSSVSVDSGRALIWSFVSAYLLSLVAVSLLSSFWWHIYAITSCDLSLITHDSILLPLVGFIASIGVKKHWGSCCCCDGCHLEYYEGNIEKSH